MADNLPGGPMGIYQPPQQFRPMPTGGPVGPWQGPEGSAPQLPANPVGPWQAPQTMPWRNDVPMGVGNGLGGVGSMGQGLLGMANNYGATMGANTLQPRFPMGLRNF